MSYAITGTKSRHRRWTDFEHDLERAVVLHVPGHSSMICKIMNCCCCRTQKRNLGKTAYLNTHRASRFRLRFQVQHGTVSLFHYDNKQKKSRPTSVGLMSEPALATCFMLENKWPLNSILFSWHVAKACINPSTVRGMFLPSVGSPKHLASRVTSVRTVSSFDSTLKSGDV